MNFKKGAEFMTELKDTVALMESDDYKDKFKAEYWQTKMRFDALHKTIVKLDAGTLKLNTDIRLLREQLGAMESYLYALEVRSEIEKIEL